MEEEEANDEEYIEEKPTKRRRATKKSKKALDAMDGNDTFERSALKQLIYEIKLYCILSESG